MKKRAKISVISLLSICITVLGTTVINSASMKQRNLVDLISLSEIILVGDVVSVTDGLENNVPYTEITVNIKEALRGGLKGTYTFRQFGLLQPRLMDDGRTNLLVTPDGWPTYAVGEEVILFLYKPAAVTGLRTTVGLFQGKFAIVDGKIHNRIDNRGLFSGMKVQKGLLNQAEEKLLLTEHGAIDAETFISVVRKAVKQRWVEERRMHHETN